MLKVGVRLAAGPLSRAVTAAVAVPVVLALLTSCDTAPTRTAQAAIGVNLRSPEERLLVVRYMPCESLVKSLEIKSASGSVLWKIESMEGANGGSFTIGQTGTSEFSGV